MKNGLTLTLAVLTLVVVGALNESTMITASAQSQPRSKPGVESTPAQPTAASLKGTSAHCFCRVTANGTEVAKPTKGGYIQPIQAEKCKDYCRGLWDSGQPQRVAWAKLLPNACGNVYLTMNAALGTMSYQQVRSGTEYGINGTQLVTSCTCPSGQLLSNAFAGNKYCITTTGTTFPFPVPDQVFQGGGGLVQANTLYQIHGPASCVTKCQ